MQSRRSFLFGSLSWTCGTLLLIDQLGDLPAFAKKTPRSPTIRGPHTLSREEWAPAIVPDHVGLADKGYICFTDEFGRLAVVDMRKPVSLKTPVKVVAELSGLGNKMVDFAVTPYAAYGLTYKEGEQNEAVVNLVSVSLTPIESPSILSDIRLGRYNEAGNICSANDLICVSGITSSGENLVSIYSAKRGAKEPTFISSMSTQMPVRAIDIADKQLIILTSANGGAKSQIDFVNLSTSDTPEITKSITVEGDYRVIARFKEMILIAGTDGSGKTKACQAQLLMGGVAPKLLSKLALDQVSTVESAAAQKDRFLVVGRSRGDRQVISLVLDRARNASVEQVIKMPVGKNDGGKNCSVVMRDMSAYVATGWSGVQLLTRGKDSAWAITSSYSIPKLAAAGVAVYKDLVVLAGSDLQLYNVGRPERPIMMNSAAPSQAIRAMVGAGSFVLCLTKEDLSLRKMDSLQNVVTTSKLQANQLCFDIGQMRAYAIKFLDKTTRVQPLKVFTDKLEQLKPFEVPGIYSRCQASKGQLMLGGLNDIAIYGPLGTGNASGSGSASPVDSAVSSAVNSVVKPVVNAFNSASSAKTASKDAKEKEIRDKEINAAGMELIGMRHFENLAVRDIAFADEAILVTAIDQNSKGFFLVLKRNDKDLHVLGTIDLPHDGLALGCQGTRAVAVGRGFDGKDVATIISFEKPSAPQIIATLPAIEGVSSVAIRDQLAVLGGRGLEILTLS